jgi:hypothetical protein
MGWRAAFGEVLKCHNAPRMAYTGHGTKTEYEFRPFRKVEGILDHGLGFLWRTRVEDGNVGILMYQNAGVFLVLGGESSRIIR